MGEAFKRRSQTALWHQCQNLVALIHTSCNRYSQERVSKLLRELRIDLQNKGYHREAKCVETMGGHIFMALSECEREHRDVFQPNVQESVYACGQLAEELSASGGHCQA